MRAVIEAFQDGIEAFMREHPSKCRRGRRRSTVGRASRWAATSSGAGRWAKRAATCSARGIQLDPVSYRGSNEMLIAPSRTAMNAPIAVIDPHLSWYGEFRFYRSDLRRRLRRLRRLDPRRPVSESRPQPLLLGRDDNRRPGHIGYL